MHLRSWRIMRVNCANMVRLIGVLRSIIVESICAQPESLPYSEPVHALTSLDLFSFGATTRQWCRKFHVLLKSSLSFKFVTCFVGEFSQVCVCLALAARFTLRVSIKTRFACFPATSRTFPRLIDYGRFACIALPHPTAHFVSALIASSNAILSLNSCELAR